MHPRLFPVCHGADLFAYFAKRAQEKTLPSFEELEAVALQLYRA